MPHWLLMVSDGSLSSHLRSVDRHRGLPYSPCGSACPPVPGALHSAASAHHGLPEGTSPCPTPQRVKFPFPRAPMWCPLPFQESTFTHMFRNNSKVFIESLSSYTSRACGVSVTRSWIIYKPVVLTDTHLWVFLLLRHRLPWFLFIVADVLSGVSWNISW